MTLVGFGVLAILGIVIGLIVELVVGAKASVRWVGTFIIGLIGGWIGTGVYWIGPPVGGVYVISAITGAIVLTIVLKLVTKRTTA